ncbi:AAA family ATPase [Bacillus sp. CGMCC 1.16607]|uniref:AAA family ATPase n=1 Tax=Bacillus sp. CGMCC 1.16607 TaxID=3351842 RepID=UPI00363C5639
MKQRVSNYTTSLKEQIKQWDEEIKDFGAVSDEREIYLVLKDLNEDAEPVLYSKILTILAISRAKNDENASIIQTWLEKALAIDPNNQIAKEFILKDHWKAFHNKFDTLHFPLFRETDNQAAKKKMVDEYIQICREFLETVDDTMDELNKQYELILQNNQENMLFNIEKIRDLYQQMFEEISNLLKALIEFDESFTGVFYASVHYENVKSHLSNINSLKSEWEEIFIKEDNTKIERETKALDQLNEMIGLHTVKERINDFYSFLKFIKSRQSLGFQTKDELSLNMILTGNPGTGKTTLARLLAKIYHELGVLPREEVIETNRSQLVGSYVGQTEENVQAIVKKAVGGVLFIDEAYSLKREGQSGNDYGQTAIDTLVSLMTSQEYSGKFAVILAGYPDEMRQFLESNTGLRSRFPSSNFIHLPNYSTDELLQIADKIAQSNDFILTDEAKVELAQRLEKEKVDDSFGNARTVKNLVLEAIFRKGSNRIDNDDSFINYIVLDKEDFQMNDEIIKTNPLEQLNQLIGLENVKKEVESLLAFVKVQKRRHESGLPIVPIQLHAVFTGNPGTGKTTVAKIYADLLREYGILKRGHLIITSRADFVASYVGQTAIKTKKKIREALGGVLFIDEAYSLFSPSSGDFGKEMIDTLVDEMTKHNENLVIVLAGYPIEMEQLLQSNPGLKSRFKKFFLFPDYSTEELVKMMEKYGKRYQYELTDAAKKYLQTEIKGKHLGANGRFATNLMDEAIQAQAVRLVAESSSDILSPTTYLEKTDVQNALEKVGRGE